MKRTLITTMILLAILLGACSKDEAPSGAPGVCDSIKKVQDEGQGHVEFPTQVDYKTDPPTSGSHYASPANTGIFTEAPPEENLVHNLEHGHVVIWYLKDRLRGPVFDELVALVKENETRVILVPRKGAFPDTASVAVFTAWGRLQKCTAAEGALVAQAREFIKRNAGDGPEGDIPGKPNA